jgi:hypothetical protein
LYEEYIVVKREDTMFWEKWGSGTITVNLSNYYTKAEVDTIKQDLEGLMVWNDVIN